MAKSKEELIRILKSNIKSFNSYRDETHCERLDLSGADLTGTNLCRANLSNVVLKDAELNFAYLHSSILKNSDLSDLTVGRADMTETDLSNSNVSGADLTNTILYGANLTKANARNLVLEGAKVREVNFTEADLSLANLSNLDLNGVNFDRAILKGTDFTSSNLSNAINLHTSSYDEATLWPDNANLPEGFTPGRDALQTIDSMDFESSLNTDFGPGVMPEEQEYEFLDTPSPHTHEEPPIGTSTTELSSPFDAPEFGEEAFDEPPSFEQFTAEQFQDPTLPEPDISGQFEPGLAVSEEEGLNFDDVDPFASSLSSSFDELSSEPKLGSIAEQEFPVGLGESLAPSPDLIMPQQAPKDPYGSHEFSATAPKRDPKPAPKPKKDPEPPAPEPIPVETGAGISPDQMRSLMGLLSNISRKLDTIETEQKSQKHTIEELKKSLQDKHSSELLAHKVEDLSAATRSIFSRVESKLDIIAQTDPLDQMDSLLGELADSMRNEQESIEGKIMELSTNLESMVSILEANTGGEGESSLTEITNNIHQMLNNLESNIREDQERADKKIEDLATIIENVSVVIENISSDTTTKVQAANKEVTESVSAISTKLTSEIYTINDTVNNINNTVGTLIELKQDESAESQIYEAFYDFEFRLQIELEKNQSRLAHLEELSSKATETLKAINEKTSKIEALENITNIPKMLETFRNQLFTEIQQTEQRTNRIREVVDDMLIQLESVFNMQLDNLQRSIGSEISNINDKLESLLDGGGAGLSPEFGQKIEALLESDYGTQKSIESLANAFQQSNSDISGKINSLNQEIIKIDQRIEQTQKESKIDDELRSIFEHLISQLGESSSESKETNEKLTKKLEDLELDIQMTLKDMDRRINKINSMIRNVYKALDSVTDLITESNRSTLKPGADKARKSLLAKAKLRDKDDSDDMDDEEP